VTAGSVYLYLTTTGNGGCLAKKDSAQITILPAVTVSILTNDSICANTGAVPVNVNVSTGQGTWSTLGSGSFLSPGSLSTSYTPSASDISTGSVQLVFISSNNGPCSAAKDTLDLTLLPAPLINFSGRDTCFGSTVQFTDLTTTPGTITSWNWTFGDGASSTTANPLHYYSSAGSYNVTLITTSSFGCTDTMSRPVNIVPVPVADFSSTAQCFVDSAFFFDTSIPGTGSISGWNWSFGDNLTSSSQNPAHAYGAAGTYAVSLVVTSSAGCKDTITKTLSVQPSPKAGISNTNVCIGKVNAFQDSSSISSGNIVSYEWTLGDGSTVPLTSFMHQYASVGQYNVQLIVTSGFGCKDTANKVVFVYPLPQAEFTSSGSCLNDGTNFTDMSTVSFGAVTSWNWFFGDGDNSSTQNPFHQFPLNGVYPVGLVVSTDHNCSDTVLHATTIYPSPIANFDASPAVIHLFENVNFTDHSTGAVSWLYDFADSSKGTSTVPNPIYNYTSGGIFNVMQVVTNSDGCTDTTSREVTVTMPPVIPSGFSPNGDGHNDMLYVRGGPYTSLDFKIYNNWGELIFQSDKQSNGWDGTRDKVVQPMGVYIYTVHAITYDNVPFNLKGDVTLLR
jgi:gliding motility-associated-like protein